MTSARTQQSDFLLPLESFNQKKKELSPEWKKKMSLVSKFGPARNRQAVAYRTGLDSTKELWKAGEKNKKLKMRSQSNPRSNLFPWDGAKDEILYQGKDFNEEDEAENTKKLINMIEGQKSSKPISRSSSVPALTKRTQTSSSKKSQALSTFTRAFADPLQENNPQPTASTFRDSNFSLEMHARTQRRFKKLGIEHRIPLIPHAEKERLTGFIESEYINNLINDDVELATEIEQLMRRSFMRKLYKQNEKQRNWFSSRVLEADIDHLSYRIKEEAIRFKLLRNQKHGPKAPEKVLDAWDSKRDSRSWLKPSRQARLRQMEVPKLEDIPKLDKFSLASPKDPYLEVIDKPIMEPSKRFMIGENKISPSKNTAQSPSKSKSRRGSRKFDEQRSYSVPSRGESRRQTPKGKEKQQPVPSVKEQANNQPEGGDTRAVKRQRIAKKMLILLQYLKDLRISSKEVFL